MNKSEPMKPFPSKYQGFCHNCQRPIAIGHDIVKENNLEWVHSECSVDPVMVTKKEYNPVHPKSNKASTYRRGKSPGSYRTKY